MIKKNMSIDIMYGAITEVRVKIHREEDNKGNLYTAYVEAYNADNSQLFVLSNDEACALYRILDEAIRDGNLKCTC